MQSCPKYKVDKMKTEQKLQNRMTKFISNVISKAIQALALPFLQPVNTQLIKVLYLKSEPVSDIVHDFPAQVKATTLKFLFQRTKDDESDD